MPKLTPVEVRMLALMVLGLNGKEIGNLMDVSKLRISHLKKQVNGKVFGKDDATSLRKMLSDYMEG